MEKETDSQLTAGQCLPAPVCCALADALALVEFGPCRGSDRPQDWMAVAAAMCAHCDGTEDVNFAAARIIAAENARLKGIITRAAQKFREDKDDGVIAAEMVMILQEANPKFPSHNAEGLASPAGSEL